MINLDEWTQEQLEQLIKDTEQDKIRTALKLFPNKNPGHVKTTLALIRYAKARLEMMDDLSKNRTDRAAKHKLEMEKHYRAIPEYAQW